MAHYGLSLHAHPRTHESAQQIANYATNFKRQQIGVLVPTKKIQKAYLNRLAAALPPDVLLQHYVSGGAGPAVDFTKPGVTVVNWASAKGLRILRDVDGKKKQIDIDLGKVKSRKAEDPVLQPGDYILVKRRIL